MRGMLIDDDETISRLRTDVSLMHLRARRPERVIEAIGQTGCGLRGQMRIEASAEISLRRTNLERGLRGFGKTGAPRPHPHLAGTFPPRTKGGDRRGAPCCRRSRTVAHQRSFQRMDD